MVSFWVIVAGDAVSELEAFHRSQIDLRIAAGSACEQSDNLSVDVKVRRKPAARAAHLG